MHLKGCLHTHTTWSDGRLTPQEVADAYADLGYDFIAFTDHDHLWKPGQEDAYAAVRTHLIALVGVELTVFEKGYFHVNHIRGDEEELYVFNHIGAHDLTLSEALDRLQAVARRLPLHAVEITHKGFRTQELDTEALGLPRLATDDAHEPAGCGRAWIEMDAPRTKDAILRAVKSGDFWNCFSRGVPA